MDFTVPPDLKQLGEKIRAFVTAKVVPYEKDVRWGHHGPSDDLRAELNALARAEGLLCLHGPKVYGGLHLSHIGKAIAFEAAGYSMLGPIATHIAAPDEGNIHMLDVIASPMQRERYLKPMTRAEARSCFMMTEPPPGAGSDPSALNTVARRTNAGWEISGRKWLITGARGAKVAIIMAKAEGGESQGGGATMFVTDMEQAGIRVVRDLDSMDSTFTGGHCEVALEGLQLKDEDVLGAPGQGFRYAQVRLAPARLTHCMRWLGAAVRAQEIASEYARTRQAFGKTLGEHEGVGFMLADNEMDIHTARLTIWHTAWVLDQGEQGGSESSMAKVICSEAIYRVADRSMQVMGALGTLRDTPVERFFRDARAFRIYDGPSEVHRWSLARGVVKGRR
jgi:alkylation response protein AidB-like acyl-CoA dehydrogenase